MKFETKVIQPGHKPAAVHDAVVVPIFQSSTYHFASVGVHNGYEYSRSGNPTRTALENVLATLEEATACVAYSSGMAATDAILSVLVPGDEVVAARNLYSGTLRLFESIYGPRQIKFVYVDGNDPESFRKVLTAKTRMIWLETPTNPQLQVFDIPALAAVAKAGKVPLVVDNTFASPYLQRPLTMGADVVIHSTTKYISGHNDVVGGAVLTNDAWWTEKMRFFQNTAGAVPGPMDCYLALRGIKTLPLRMRQHCANAQALAEFLHVHPKVSHVYYPGLPSHPDHALAKKQMSGFGGMVSFDIKGGKAAAQAFFEKMKVIHFAESLGGVESLACHPQTMSHAVLTEPERNAAGITENMIRMSIGIEHPDDLIEDVRQALG